MAQRQGTSNDATQNKTAGGKIKEKRREGRRGRRTGEGVEREKNGRRGSEGWGRREEGGTEMKEADSAARLFRVVGRNNKE